MKKEKQRPDTPYEGSWAHVQSQPRPEPGRVPPHTLPPTFRHEQTRINVRLSLGTSGFTAEQAEKAYEEELALQKAETCL